jgi:hypothetical protein
VGGHGADRFAQDFGPDRTGFSIARLHYNKTTGLGTLYWRDRNLNITAPLDAVVAL